ncbi:MAG TPA: tetratricopeptide repeat protein [Pyrinomonadaceae bacterium]|jgi:tetratricopeptide (TPR) repeat protein|nr:tetratricopeptide repeat protein [Pyrinomonadaceae bacterium]
MSRENVLFAIIGVLSGYIVAFTFVIYVNQNQPAAPKAAPRAGDAQATADLPSDHPPLPVNTVKDQQKLLSAAEQAAQKAREEPSSFEAQADAANAYAQAEKYEEAIDFLTRANELRPGDYDTLLKLGQANLEARRYTVAEQWYREALAKRGDDLDTRSSLALTLILRDPPDFDKAIAELRRALEIDPRHEPTLHNLTLVYKEAGRLPDAETTLARLEKVNPNNNDLPKLRAELKKPGGAQTGTSEPGVKSAN